MASPKRYPFGNRTSILNRYRSEFLGHMMVGAALSWPLAVAIGRRAQRYQGGVAIVPYQRWVQDHPNTYANRTTKKYFRRYAFYTCVASGFLYARYMVNDLPLKNQFYTRPDLKPFPAMVKDDPTYDKVVYKQMLE